ncbi:GNAT family N-acetyltransferase [uncultured Nitratireductor sp.]|uniref:GNAT family N-acetyltransferase n=1 Tax=uncultured Nitratireductor sp. TaxID=520953 RepID=UPI0025D55970|nr:GNAT family N-acetyltransferase [uncultured Nitratireductor sp.]
MEYQIAPLTPALWPAFEDLFGKQGACYGCWCTHFRLPPAVRRENNRERNKDHIMARVEAGPPPGLLLLDESRADGWMQIGPRTDIPEWNNKGRVSAPLEDDNAGDETAWAISCFFLRSCVRGKGLSHRLVAGGVDYARARGARFLDACPIAHSRDARSIGLFVGSTRVFEKAGFQTVAQRKSGRPLMRLTF